MINFNVPPFTGKEMEYMKQAVDAQKICGDGQFTKKCNEWIEQKTKTTKKTVSIWGFLILYFLPLESTHGLIGDLP